MIQTIITYIILFITFTYVGYRFVKSIIKFSKNKSVCSGCSGKSCEGCPFNRGMDIKIYKHGVN